MHKLQSYFIYKFESSILKKHNYKRNISLDQARANGEVVRLGDCELLRAIRRIKGVEFNAHDLSVLEKERNGLRKLDSSGDIKDDLRDINNQIDNILFVPEIINVHFTDTRHYRKIMLNGGIRINGHLYKRLLCGAGMARRSTVMFMQEGELYDQVEAFLNCNRNEEYKVNPNKFNAYYALASSASHPVTVPVFTVVKDYEVSKSIIVDFLTENSEGYDPVIAPKEIEQAFNRFDGQGLISPRIAKIWADDMGLDYVPSAFVFRGAWVKGLLVVFDFHRFVVEENEYDTLDIYGSKVNLLDVDVILSASQFKLAGAYSCVDDYKAACDSFGYGWGVSRVSPKQDKDITTTTYQYLQSLDMTDSDIEKVTQKSIDWLSGASGDSWKSTVMFLLGEGCPTSAEDVTYSWFSGLTDPILKSLLAVPELIQDRYIHQYLLRIVNKKIRESYMGILQVDGNYQFMIADPYAQMQHILNMPVTGLLGCGKYYSKYWNEKGINTTTCFRSPNTWRSECLLLDFIDNPETNDWYGYIYSSIIFNAHDESFMRLSGADVDGDICMTTPNLVDYVYADKYLTPTYERKSAEKKKIELDDLWKSDILSFGSDIGLVTNYGTTYYDMLSLFDENDTMHDIIINRLKICNCLQSCEIDKTKGIKTIPLPDYWSKYIKITDDMDEIEKEHWQQYNKLVCKKRPYFMRYVYPKTYGAKYQQHVKTYENMSISKFGKPLNEILASKICENGEISGENALKVYFYQYSPLQEGNGVMNRVCRYMEGRIKEIKQISRLSTTVVRDYFAELYKDDISDGLIAELRNIYKEYRSYRKLELEDVDNKEQLVRLLRKKADALNANSVSLVNAALQINTGFAFSVFGSDMVSLLVATDSKIYIPGSKEDDAVCVNLK